MAAIKHSALIHDRLLDWLDDVKNHELNNIIDLVEQAKALVIAAESIPEEKVNQFIENLKHDLSEFYQHTQSQLDSSLYVHLMKEKFWQTMADVTDRAQVEWVELDEDFDHHGHYATGDYIGFGKIICTQCQHAHQIYHFSTISTCEKCGGGEFIRESFSP